MTIIPDRQSAIDGLRALVDLFERVPNLPVKTYYGHGLFGADAEELPRMDAIADALRAAGVDFTDETIADQRRIDVRLDGLTFYVNHYLDAHTKRLMAQMSYSDNVQVTEDVRA